MPYGPIEKWERRFRAAAEADNYALLNDHLRRLELPDSPELLLEGTIMIVRAWSGYWAIDGRAEPFDRFLEMQPYNPADAPDAPYAFTFNLHGRAFGRVLSPADIKRIDLADLYNHPWDEYEIAGYNPLIISRADWNPLTIDEVDRLEREVTADLRFDYARDELSFCFDDTSFATHILVHLHEGEAEEIEE